MREVRYRLKDNYARFYLRYIEPKKEIVDAGAYRFVSLDALDGWDTIMGLQFENLVLNHYPALVDPLRIGNSLIESAAPYSRMRKGDGVDGLQIDLLLQTKHNNYVVEIGTMLINFVTEFLYQKFIVYRGTIDTNERAKKDR